MGRMKETRGEEVLLPSREVAPRPPSLAAIVLGFLGLLVLCSSTLPALLRARELDEAHARLREEVRAKEQEAEALRRELKAVASQAYLRTRDTRRLLNGGRDYVAEREARLAAEREARLAAERAAGERATGP
jgi:hypothetical protein